jgi:ATP-dependent helicase Lhr and Lhr-like helicase
VYQGDDVPTYLDRAAAGMLAEGRDNFARYQLDRSPLLASGRDTYLFLWSGDRVADTVTLALRHAGLVVAPEGLALRVDRAAPEEVAGQLRALVAAAPPDPALLAATVANQAEEKYDHYLPEALLARGYAARRLDPAGAWQWIRQLEL